MTPNEIPRTSDLRPGVKVRDITSGPCTIVGRPYRSTPAGSDAVDVEGTNWDGKPIRWTAVVSNLRWPEDVLRGIRITDEIVDELIAEGH